RTMVTAMLLAFLLIPLWVFSHGVVLIAAGAFLMQFMVQGAWGVIPAHINELTTDKVRALLPGFAYQIGILVGGGALSLEALAARHFTYGQAMAAVLAIVVLVGSIVIGAGPEARHVAFGQDTALNVVKLDR